VAFGPALIVLGGRELAKTRLEGVKGMPEKLITTGPYAVIRHPINLGLMLAFPGWYLLWGVTWSLILPAVLVIVLVVETFWEERNIRKTFAKEYEEYRRRVGMFLPRFRKS
jgi:protein-S-isoprenylcysteine O-methyltransferase Ste14